jgi:hypothetical protein
MRWVNVGPLRDLPERVADRFDGDALECRRQARQAEVRDRCGDVSAFGKASRDRNHMIASA